MSGIVPLPPFLDDPLHESGRFGASWTGYFQNQALQLAQVHKGKTDGSDANAGDIGEYLTATAGPVSLSNAAVANVVSLSLTAGDWDVSGHVQFVTSGGTLNTVGAGVAGIDVLINATFPAGSTQQQLATAPRRYNVTAPTTVWVVAVAFFSGGVSVTGTVRARRMR